jgi:hypothetical protein
MHFMAIEGDQNRHGPSPRALNMCGSIIKPTLLSFLVFYSLHVKTLFVLLVVGAINLEENESSLEGF